MNFMQEIEDAWEKTCKILLGGEIGSIGRYKGHLASYVTPLAIKKSAISGEQVALHDSGYCKGAKFISYSESGLAPAASPGSSNPLSINEIKDLDSILESIGGRVYYSGNIVLGNSKNVSNSNRCINSSNVYASSDVYDSQYIAYSSIMRYMKYAFGADTVAESAFVIGGFNMTHDTRCFEVNQTFYSSDCHYVANLEACNECMFSFNLRNASYCIGNLSLQKSEYEKIKAGLLEDIRNTLESKKRVPRIIDFLAVRKTSVPLAAGVKKQELRSSHEQVSRAQALAKINSSFSDTCALVLGRKLGPMQDYSKWLLRHVPQPRLEASRASGESLVIPGWNFFETVRDFVGFEESLELGKKAISPAQAQSLSMSNALETLKPLSITSPWFYRKSMGMVDVAISRESAYCYWGSLYVFSRHCAYSHWPRECEFAFGCNLVFSSKFCVKCHDSSNLSRCLEVNDSNNCSDCYFCHNCEGLQESMFCFNAKNKKYAVFNVEIGREKYLALKKSVLGSLSRRLENAKSLDFDIFNIGCMGPGKAKRAKT